MRVASATAVVLLISLPPRIASAEEVWAWRVKSILNVVDAVRFARLSEIAVEGQPHNIVSVGGAGQTHETE